MHKQAGKRTRATSIEIFFDLTLPNEINRMQEFVAGFGEGYTEVEFILGEAAIVRVFPGGAKDIK